MKSTEQKLEEIKSQGYKLDFSVVFNDAFETWKKTALMSGLALLIFAIVFGGLSVGLILAMGGFQEYTNFASGIASNESSIVGILSYCLVMCLIAGLTNPFSAGLIKMAHQADKGEEVSVGDAFQCYKQPYFLPLFIEALIVSLFTVFITTLVQMAFPMQLGISLLATLFSLLVTFLMCMAVPLITFGNLKPFEAIRGSIILVGKQFFWILLLVITAYLLGFVGFIAFCIGVLFTMPFVYNVYYSIYKHSVGIPEESEIDEIGFSDDI